MEQESTQNQHPQDGPPERPRFERKPLGKPYAIQLSREELTIAYKHRSITGEPIQSFVRRLLREYNLEEDKYLAKEPEDGRKP